MNEYHKQSGFGAVLVVVIVAVVAILGGSGYVVYKTHHKTAKPPTTSSSVAKTSTPPAKKSSGSTSTSTQPTTAYFTIKEWGVQAPYSGTDLSYNTVSGNANLMGLTSQQVNEAGGCNATSDLGNIGTVGKYLPTDDIPGGPQPETAQQYLSHDFSGSAKPSYSKVGNYYYIYWTPQDGCTTDTTAINQATSAIENIVDNLQAVSN